ncbi:MAG: hypothetical protein FH761_02770 [Firmicutes bacterium]|nr:hypothetical protein [Bacillota bacterium]
MRLFGPTHREIWKVLSEDINGEFEIIDSLTNNIEVRKQFKDWEIILEVYKTGSKKDPVLTKISCEFYNKFGFKFKIFNEYFHNYFKDFFDMQDINANDSSYKDYIIRSNSSEAMNIILNNTTFKEILANQDNILFEVNSVNTYEENNDNKIYTISIKAPGIIKDNEVLKEYFELIGLVLLEIDKISNENEHLNINNYSKFNVAKEGFKKTLSNGLSIFMNKDDDKELEENNPKNEVSNNNEDSDTSTDNDFSSEVEIVEEYSNMTNDDVNNSENQDIKINETKNQTAVDISDETNNNVKNESSDDNKVDIKENDSNTETIDYYKKLYNEDDLNMDNLNIDTNDLDVDTSKLNIDTNDLEEKYNKKDD